MSKEDFLRKIKTVSLIFKEVPKKFSSVQNNTFFI